MQLFSNRRVIACGVAALALVGAGCSSNDSGGRAGNGVNGTVTEASALVTGPISGEQEEGDPQSGGTLRVGASTPPSGLDPVTVTLDGSVGSSELASIYGVLVSYDPESGSYEGELAKTISSNGNADEWKLELREGVEFSDGTPLDSLAVVSSIERFRSSPASSHFYTSHENNLVNMSTPDDLTVKFQLKDPDPKFPWVLTQGWGMVASPTALKDVGDDEFNLNPVGAGPYVVDKFVPNSALKLNRSKSFYDSDSVYLEHLEFSWTPDPVAQLQALNTDGLDVIRLSDPEAITEALKDSSVSGYVWKRHMAPLISLNFDEKRPTSQLKVRRAIAMGLNPTNLNDRLYAGTGDVTMDLFPSGPLMNDVAPLDFNPAKAKELVAEAKRETGWDGSLVLSGLASSEDQALAIQASLGAVGIEVKTDLVNSYSVFGKTLLSGDFDMFMEAISVMESAPSVSLTNSMLRQDQGDVVGYHKTELYEPMANAVYELGRAKSVKELISAGGALQELWNEQVPAISLGSAAHVWLWKTERVSGVMPTTASTALFGSAWKHN